MAEWLDEHQAWFWTLGGISVGMFIASLFIMPAIIVRIPKDYFAHEYRPPPRWARQHTVIRAALRVLKNLLGGALMLAGIAMLVLPGQGLLTLVIGFFLIDFPGKYRFEQWLVSKRPVARPLNWLRHRAGRESLVTRANAPVDGLVRPPTIE